MVLVLKRFSWTTEARAKIDTRVHIPLKKLDMSPYLSSASRRRAEASGGARYNLRSVVVHHGSSLRIGHYTAYCYNDEKSRF
jgi:ubiquitin carboxyl-terminal hydrolase 44/49